MHRRTTIPGVLALTTMFLAAGCGEATEDRAADRATPDAPIRGSIVEIAQAAGHFSALLRAVEAAGLTATLKNDGPFTVFAPTDGAFAALPAEVLDSLMDDPDALGEVLLYHVVPGELTARDLREADRLETAQGEELVVRVTDQGVTINDTYLLTAAIRAANGTLGEMGPRTRDGPPEVDTMFVCEHLRVTFRDGFPPIPSHATLDA